MKRGIIIWALIILGVIFIGYAATKIKFTGNQILSIEEINGLYSVNIENFRYNPQEITINVGETIKWTNLDAAKHTITSSNDGPLNSALLSQEESYSYTFESKGEFEYYCIPHPYMEGKIIVE